MTRQLRHFWQNPIARVASRSSAPSGRASPDAGSIRLPLAPGEYQAWIARYDHLTEADRKAIRGHIERFEQRPTISLLLLLQEPQDAAFLRTLETMRRQLYPHWELCVAPYSEFALSRLYPLLERSGMTEPRVKYLPPAASTQRSSRLNAALDIATGNYLAVIDPGDALPEQSLYHIALEINRHPDAAVIYADHDEFDARGRRHNPCFKPDWDPEFILAGDYPSYLTTYETKLVRSLGGFRSEDNREEYDLTLRCGAAVPMCQIRHIPAVLYHAAAPCDAGLANSRITSRRLRRPVPEPAPRVSIIVPTRDGYDVLRRSLQSILGMTIYPDYEILVVNNGSKDRKTLDYLRHLTEDDRVRVLDYDAAFNFAAINNHAVQHATGEILALVNDDVEVISRDWLREMVSHAVRPDIGAVGAKLYFPDGSLQHAGIITGLGGVARHRHKDVAGEAPGYLGCLRAVHSASAVTGACLLVRKALYDEVGGLDAEDLPVAFNDVDFCLRLVAAGYRNLWTPFAELYHVESATRGYDDTPRRKRRLAREARYLKSKWADRLFNDPAYNPNLSLSGNGFRLAWPPRVERPWVAIEPLEKSDCE